MTTLGLALPENIDPAEVDFVKPSRILDAGIYDAIIETAYTGVSSGGAISLTVNFKTATNQFLNQVIYLTSGTAKGKKTTYTDKRDGSEKALPGFVLGNSLALAASGKAIGVLESVEKMVSIFNYDLKKDVPTKVPMLMDLVGKHVKLGVIKQIVDRNVKNNAGIYVPSGETREENDIDKVFTEDGFTSTEIAAKATEPAFINTWEKTNKGEVRNRSKGASSSNGAVAGSPVAPPSLFNK